MFSAQAEVSVIAGEQMVCHEGSGGGEHEGGPYPQQVGCTPEGLAECLRVPRDARHTCLPQV